jgi:carboxymethylenebutenolidase
VIQEIFGVNQHIRKVTDGFAAEGYLALAPAIFDRVQRDFEIGYTPADVETGRATRGKIQLDDLVADVRAAVKALQAEGLKVGVVGYCLGGTLAWLSATRIDGVAAAVCYYGGGIAAAAAERPRCPVLIHWGETDASIPPDHWETVKKAHPTVPAHVYPAGHGFNCDERGSYHAESATLARQRTLDFFRQHLG